MKCSQGDESWCNNMLGLKEKKLIIAQIWGYFVDFKMSPYLNKSRELIVDHHLLNFGQISLKSIQQFTLQTNIHLNSWNIIKSKKQN